jgi:hypothetical protein
MMMDMAELSVPIILMSISSSLQRAPRSTSTKVVADALNKIQTNKENREIIIDSAPNQSRTDC